MLVERPWYQGSKFVLLFVDCSLLATADLGQSGIWVLCLKVEDSARIPLLILRSPGALQHCQGAQENTQRSTETH